MAEQAIDFARGREAFEPVWLFDRSRRAALRRPGSWAQAFRHRLPHVLGDHRLGLARVDHDAALGLFLGDVEKGARTRSCWTSVLAFEPVWRPAPPPRRARKPLLDGNIEHEGEIGHEAAKRQPLERVDQRRRHAARSALIGARGIEEAVAHDPYALRERLADRGVHMVRPRHGEEQGFRERPELPDVAGEQGLADLLSRRRAARLARGNRVAPRARSLLTRMPTCVDLPAPSPPSKVINLPGSTVSCRIVPLEIGVEAFYSSQPKARTRSESSPRWRNCSGRYRRRHRGGFRWSPWCRPP